MNDFVKVVHEVRQGLIESREAGARRLGISLEDFIAKEVAYDIEICKEMKLFNKEVPDLIANLCNSH